MATRSRHVDAFAATGVAPSGRLHDRMKTGMTGEGEAGKRMIRSIIRPPNEGAVACDGSSARRSPP